MKALIASALVLKLACLIKLFLIARSGMQLDQIIQRAMQFFKRLKLFFVASRSPGFCFFACS